MNYFFYIINYFQTYSSIINMPKRTNIQHIYLVIQKVLTLVWVLMTNNIIYCENNNQTVKIVDYMANGP